MHSYKEELTAAFHAALSPVEQLTALVTTRFLLSFVTGCAKCPYTQNQLFNFKGM